MCVCAKASRYLFITVARFFCARVRTHASNALSLHLFILFRGEGAYTACGTWLCISAMRSERGLIGIGPLNVVMLFVSTRESAVSVQLCVMNVRLKKQ